jgi:hypothetical protein
MGLHGLLQGQLYFYSPSKLAALSHFQHQATGPIVSEEKQCLHKKCAGRHSVDADIVEMVREAFHGSQQMAYLQPNVFFKQDGVPPHWGPYNETASE